MTSTIKPITVCATTSPFDCLPQVKGLATAPPVPPAYF